MTPSRGFKPTRAIAAVSRPLAKNSATLRCGVPAGGGWSRAPASAATRIFSLRS
jgi:hypothetical protein